MATRLFSAGFETNSVAELPLVNSDTGGNASPVISSTKAKTGTYSMRWQPTINGAGRLFASNLAQVRCGFYLNHNGLQLPSSSIAFLVRFPNSGATNPASIRWSGSTGLLELLIGGASVASVAFSSAGFPTANTWYHIGCTFKRHATTGYFTLYVDGLPTLTFTGNTGSLDITSVLLMGVNSAGNGGWASSAYVDDFYVDDDTGGSDVAPNSPRFLWSPAATAGTNAAFTPLSSTNISNVDDTDASAPDDDTTYNFASAASLKDTFNTTDITVPTGYNLVARIPVAYAKKTNAGVASTLSLVDYDGSAYTVGTAQTLGTAYGIVMDRFTLTPSAAVLTQTNFNSSEAGYQSSGSF